MILCLHRGVGVVLRHHGEPVRQGDGRLLVICADNVKVEVAELDRQRADEGQQEHDQAPLRARPVEVMTPQHEGEVCHEQR